MRGGQALMVGTSGERSPKRSSPAYGNQQRPGAENLSRPRSLYSDSSRRHGGAPEEPSQPRRSGDSAPAAYQGVGGDGRRGDPRDGGQRDDRPVHRQRPAGVPARALPHHPAAAVPFARPLLQILRGPQGEKRAGARLLPLLGTP